jgi:hypothetical protein
MTIPQATAITKAALASMLLTTPTFGCDPDCGPYRMESGDYRIIAPADGRLAPEDEWLLGGELHVDRDADLAILRYSRDGTTYEVEFTLEDW